MSKDDLARRLRATFLIELEDQVRALDAELLALESEPAAPNRIRSLFRSAHAVKGAARVAGVPLVEQACHALESLFARIRDREASLTAADFELLFATTDALSDARGRLHEGKPIEEGPLPALLPRLRGAPTGPPPPAAEPEGESAATREAVEPADRERDAAVEVGEREPVGAVDQTAGAFGAQDGTVRVLAEKLDALATVTGELMVVSDGIARQSAEWLDVRDDLSRWAARHAAVTRGRNGAGGSSKGAELDLLLNRLVQRVDAIARSATGRTSVLARVTDDLYDGVRRLRLRPLADIMERLPRVARDIAVGSGKRIRLEIEGDDIEADRVVIDALREPLLHLVRNAADHGIESAEVREAAGKPPEGTIRLSATLRSGRLRVVVEDDGAGVDTTAVRERIRRRGGTPPTDDRELAWLLLEGGISTRPEANEVSGRGVGLDLVRSALHGIGGAVRLAWRPGRGTRFTVEAPPSPTAMRAVIVATGDQLFALPAGNVERIVKVRPERVRQLEGRPVLPYGDVPAPIVSLAAVLGPPLQPRPPATTVPALILEAGDDVVALAVDELVDEGDIVVRPIDGSAAIPHIAGGALLANGRIALVLTAATLVAAALRRRTSEPVVARETEAPARRVLVADDSITTRTLEQSVLEAAGFHVTAAVDGEDAWQKLQEHGAELIVADVEMPRLDGHELCRRVRASKRFAEIPIVLVTGLESDEDRARGLEAGADAYITKSSFDQTALLDTIRRLIG